MLKLYYSPGACSLVPHIALEEAGAEYELVRVMLAQGEHLTPEYALINPRARVPALATDRGVVTENVAILNLIADLCEKPGSVPRRDPYEAARCNELLAWCASTIHISFATIWRGSRFSSDESIWPLLEQGGRDALERHFAELDSLCVDDWLAPGGFSAADSYALTFIRWAKRIGFDIGRYPRWVALAGRLLEWPAVQRALDQEGLQFEEFQP
jgi:glutathione S-transferase